MSSTGIALLKLLADREFHSGRSLGETLGLSRAAIWKQIQSLQQNGLLIEAAHARGYRLRTQIELLDRDAILKKLPATIRRHIHLEVFEELESTNQHLMQSSYKISAAEIPVCLAEKQHAGRGRFGRSWHTGFASSIALSLRWRFMADASSLAGLSLAIGVAVCKVVEAAGVSNVGIKWPNDLLCNQAKLAGILIELTGDAAGPCEVVVGIGLNVSNSSAERKHADLQIDQPWTDLLTLLPAGQSLSRQQIAANLIAEVVSTLQHFSSEGFVSFRKNYEERDALRNQAVHVQLAGQTLAGIACGVDDRGGLLLAVGDEIMNITSGEVQVRAT